MNAIVLTQGVSVSPEQMGELMQQKGAMPTAEVFQVAFGYEWAAKMVLFAAGLGLITSFNGFYIASSRLLFSLGRGGMLPHWFAKVHPAHGTPSNAIVFLGAIALTGPFIGKAGLVPIVNSSALAFTVVLMLTAFSAIRLRHSCSHLDRPYKSHILTLYMGAAVSTILTLLMLVPASQGYLSPLEFTIFGSWMVVGLLAYLIRRSKGDMDHNEQSYLILGIYR